MNRRDVFINTNIVLGHEALQNVPVGAIHPDEECQVELFQVITIINIICLFVAYFIGAVYIFCNIEGIGEG